MAGRRPASGLSCGVCGPDPRPPDQTRTFGTIVSAFEITGLVIVGVGFLGLIAYVARHARQWDDD